MAKIHDEDARIFKAFCDENRLMIISLLRSGEKCACVLLDELEIAQSTLSHHMKILCESGVVGCRKKGKWTYYFLSGEGCDKTKQRLAELTTLTDPCACADDCSRKTVCE